MVRRERGAVQVLLKAPAIPPAKSWEADSMWDLWSCVRRWEEALLPTTLWPELTLTLASVRITIFAAGEIIQYPLEKDSNFDEEEESVERCLCVSFEMVFALVCNLFFLYAYFLQFLFLPIRLLFSACTLVSNATPTLTATLKRLRFWCNERFAATWSLPLSSIVFYFLPFVGIWLLCNDLQLLFHIHSIWKPVRWYEFENVVRRRYLSSPLLLDQHVFLVYRKHLSWLWVFLSL